MAVGLSRGRIDQPLEATSELTPCHSIFDLVIKACAICCQDPVAGAWNTSIPLASTALDLVGGIQPRYTLVESPRCLCVLWPRMRLCLDLGFSHDLCVGMRSDLDICLILGTERW